MVKRRARSSQSSDRISQPERGPIATATTVRRADSYELSALLDPRLARLDRAERRQYILDAYRESLPYVEDLRRYVPVPTDSRRSYYDLPRRTVSGASARYVYRPRGVQAARNVVGDQLAYPHFKVGFEKPYGVVECLRRFVRRQMMFASGHGGRSTRYFRRRRNKWSSAFSC